MATTMRKDTIDKQYEQYKSAYIMNQSRGNIRGIESLNGKAIPTRMLNRNEFESVINEHLREMSSTDNKKYKLGEKIFYDMNAMYSKKQITHFRREVGAELESLWNDTKSYQELVELVAGHTYKSGGKLHIK